jgi:hypothetical protein
MCPIAMLTVPVHAPRYNHRVRPPGDRESDMPTVEERLAWIEGRVEEHTRSMEEFRSGVLRLDQRMDSLDLKVDRVRDELASRIEAVRGELTSRCDRIDLRLVGLPDRFFRRGPEQPANDAPARPPRRSASR